MTERMSHEEYVSMHRRRVAELARQILAGDLDVLDGSYQIAELLSEIEWEDDDLRVFFWVISETDHLPIGAEALNWSDEALARKELNVCRAREWASTIVRQPCETLVIRFVDA